MKNIKKVIREVRYTVMGFKATFTQLGWYITGDTHKTYTSETATVSAVKQPP
ncbi:hypothetical protein ACFSY7_08385 [Kurthia populi]|uniref:Uncharacterized protein n=1 Tax=Kurthia populi TaxID=1562132 RepID=A0ABW5XZQ5_9BACL